MAACAGLLGCGSRQGTAAGTPPRGTTPRDAGGASDAATAVVAVGPPQVLAPELGAANIGTSRHATVRALGTEKRCNFQGASPTPAADARRLAETCGATLGLTAVVLAERAQLDASGPRATFPLRIEAGRCVRLYVVAASTVGAVSAVLRDAEGAIVAESVGDGPLVVVPARGSACFTSPSGAFVDVALGRGQGEIGLAAASGGP